MSDQELVPEYLRHRELQKLQYASGNYKRPSLPVTCIDYSSPDGKILLRESLLEGYANLFFKLSAQFITQHEQAYCGVTSLVMTINALDPDKTWRSAWTNSHTTLLDSDVPLETIKIFGLDIVQFNQLALCNNLITVITKALNTEESFEKFKEDVISSVRGESTVIVPNFCRKTLEQEGWGHFSPLAAYHSASEKVLVMDVARYKYPPYWVSLKLLHKAMSELDYATKEPREYWCHEHPLSSESENLMEAATVQLLIIIIQFILCLLIMPLQVVCIFTLRKNEELRQNASLQIVCRLIAMDFLQTSALLVTGFYYVFPKLAEFQLLHKICSVALVTLFLALFPMQLMLTVYRLLVVTHMTSYKQLPFFLKIFEGLIWASVIILSVATWVTDAYIFGSGGWYYNEKSLLAPLLAGAELYFCLPLCTTTYLLYTLIIIMVFSKQKLFVKFKYEKEEWSLFLQCTTMFLSETIGIVVYHEMMRWPEILVSHWFGLFNTVNWTMSFCWTSLFLLLCNRTVKSKLIWKVNISLTSSVT